MRQVIGLSLAVLLGLPGFLFALPEVFWRETDKERIKILVQGDRVLERVSYPKKAASSLASDSPAESAAPAAPAFASSTGKWTVSRTVNPMTDRTTISLSLASEDAKNRRGEPITLHIRSENDAISLYICWDEYLGSDTIRTISRIGGNQPSALHWGVSTSHDAAFYPRNPSGFIKDLMAADRVVFQVTPYSESPQTATFDVRGLRAVFSPITENRAWRK